MTRRANAFNAAIGAVNDGASFAAFAQSLNPGEHTSMLDIVTLGLTDPTLIKRELRTKGVDLDLPADLEYAMRVFNEAVSYYDRIIAADPALALRPIVLQLKPSATPDEQRQYIYNIFQIAAGQVHAPRHNKFQIMQACALLRIAYVIDFIERDPRLSLLPEVARELHSILDRHITPPKHAGTYAYYSSRVPGDIPLPLVKFEVRMKERDRIITKLLHKSENRTGRVLDNIGFRVTTATPMDSLRLLYALFFDPVRKIFPGVNIRPGESKNLLFDPAELQHLLSDPEAASKLVAQLSKPTIDHADVTSTEIVGGTNDNRDSSPNYRAIHFVFDLPLKVGRQRISFPVEIQILDRHSALTNEDLAPHSDYVRRQMEAVRDRLVGNNKNLLKYDKPSQE